jgi:response regulator NasT
MKGQRRILLSGASRDLLSDLRSRLAALGYDAVTGSTAPARVKETFRRLQPDAAIMGRHPRDSDSLAAIATITHELGCPTVALLPEPDFSYVRRAVERGAFAYVVGLDGEELGAALEVALERFREYQGLQEAFARRAIVEQAKGILMVRHGIAADEAFSRLRDHARRNSRRVVDVAGAVVESHLLLVADGARPASAEGS